MAGSEQIAIQCFENEIYVISYAQKDIPRLSFTIQDNMIHYVESFNFLGITFDCPLTWKSHILIVNRPISQTVFMLSIAINRAEHVYATVIIKHNYMLMCNHKIAINIMLCLLNSTGHI